MHLLENHSHTLLSFVFLFLPVHLCFRDRCLLVTLLKFLVGQEVLSHDATDFSEIIKDSKAGILCLLLWRAETAIGTVHVESECGRGAAKGKYDWVEIKTY